MKAEILEYQDRIPVIEFGDPLLTTTEDNEKALRAVMAEIPLRKEDALVFMGHGTTHYANNVYAALDYMLKDLGYPNAFLGTVEAYPCLDNLIRQVKAFEPEKVILTPFMMVAGDHATNDLSGDDEESWRSQFEKAGFRVECLLRGMGEYATVRKLFLEHAASAVSRIPEEN